MITLLRLIAAGLLLSTSACATIVSDSSYPVVLNSEPTGAKIEITDKRGMTRFAGMTPATAQLDSGDGYFSKARYTVTMKKDGYADYSTTITPSLNGWYWGNFIFGGLIGFLIVDPLSGAMYEIDHSMIMTSLQPASVSAPTASLQDAQQLIGTDSSIAAKSVAGEVRTVQGSSIPSDVSDRLREIKRLKDEGILGEAEYNTKKKELLNAL